MNMLLIGKKLRAHLRRLSGFTPLRSRFRLKRLDQESLAPSYRLENSSRAMSRLDLHENFSRDDEIVGSSDRTFGLTLAGVGLLIGTIKLWRGQNSAWWWLAAAAVLLAAAVIHAPALAPLNRLWLRLGLVLYKVVNPVVMAFIFIAAVLPTGLVMRALGKDPLRLKRDAGAASYWIAREPADARSEPMKQQF